MNIKTADSKGRITIGEDGVSYSVTKQDDGTIIASPISIPQPPRLENDQLRAVYVTPPLNGSRTRPSTITIYSNFGDNSSLARFVAPLANEQFLPVVVDSTGIGIALADTLAGKVDRGVISINAGGQKKVD